MKEIINNPSFYSIPGFYGNCMFYIGIIVLRKKISFKVFYFRNQKIEKIFRLSINTGCNS